jgi:uncharacterized membrane protein YfcA
MQPLEASLLVLVGLAVGAYAAAIGSGGGFIIAPLLLLRHEAASPPEVTAASLAVVLILSTTSSILYWRAGRLDAPLALVLAAAAVPAALVGGALTAFVPRQAFALGIAALLLVLGVRLTLRPRVLIVEPVRGGWLRERRDALGQLYLYRVPLRRALVGTAGASFLASLSGIGGGPFFMPLATRVMRMPHAIAVAVAQVVFVGLAGTTVALQVAAGHIGEPLEDVPWLGLGVLLGNPAGVWLNRRLGEGPLTRALAFGLLLISARTAWGALRP